MATFSLCPHMLSLCFLIPSSFKKTSHIIVGHTLATLWIRSTKAVSKFSHILRDWRLGKASAYEFYGAQFQSVQSLSCGRPFPTTWNAAPQASLSITKSQSLLKLTSIKLVMPSDHLTLCHPLLFLPSVFPSIRVFSNESVLHIKWSEYWSFNFSISPSNEHSGLISFRIDRFHLLADQGTLKSLLQHHSSKASILQCSTFFIVQLSHPYMTTGKTTTLQTRYFVDCASVWICLIFPYD